MKTSVAKSFRTTLANLRLSRRLLVAGMESSGSTLVFQIVNELDVDPVKVHHYVPNARKAIVTYRDPRDIICSYAKRVYASLIEEEGLEAALIASYKRLFQKFHRQDALRSYRDDGRALLLKYEDFFGGREVDMFQRILGYLNLSVPDSRINRILEEFSIDKNRERASQFSQFGEFDPKSGVHGNHITSGGRSGVWKETLTPGAKVLIKQNLSDFLIEFGYERDHQW